MAKLSTVFHSIVSLRGALLLGVVLLSGCNESQPEALFLKESEIQSGLNKQLPINGLVNVQIHIPDEVASLSGLFTERVVKDPIVEARIELSHADLSLVGGEAPSVGRVELLAEPIIRTRLLGVEIAETLNIELSGQLRAKGDQLYFEPMDLNEKGSFFLNNFVPNEYRDQFVANLNDWFVAYFSAYPIYQFTSDDRFSTDDIDTSKLVIEDDLVRFQQ